MACATDIMGPDTSPWMRRAPTSIGRLVASPQTAEKHMNNKMEVTKVRTSPKRRPIHPVSGCMIAAASMYELTAQVPSEVLTPRLPEMAGTETLTMVMSRISMKDAVAIAAVRNKSLPPCNGGYSESAAGLAGEGIGPAFSRRGRDCDARWRPRRHSLCRDPGYTPGYRRPACRLLPPPAPARCDSSCPLSRWR